MIDKEIDRWIVYASVILVTHITQEEDARVLSPYVMSCSASTNARIRGGRRSCSASSRATDAEPDLQFGKLACVGGRERRRGVLGGGG